MGAGSRAGRCVWGRLDQVLILDPRNEEEKSLVGVRGHRGWVNFVIDPGFWGRYRLLSKFLLRTAWRVVEHERRSGTS